MLVSELIHHLSDEVGRLPDFHFSGRVTSVGGIMAECSGLDRITSIGSRCRIEGRNGQDILTEVIGFKEHTALLLPFKELDGVGPGCKVSLISEQTVVHPHHSWLGRIIDAMGDPIDHKGKLLKGSLAYPLKSPPPPAHERRRVKHKIDLGVRAINTFLTCCKGQRMGIFAGSGVGKSMLISMFARYAESDVKVIGLIGERGREVQEFIEDYLGPEGMKTTILVVATSNESALMRRQATYLTLAIAEYFRDTGQDVLCIIDSVTRFAMAQREIGLSAGEPPTSKGYTPTVFSELPKLLERAGPGVDGVGDITGLFSVLVEGDDHNEPIADAVRGILDGHIVLDRAIAQRNRFPAINILKSISRTMPHCNTDDETRLIGKAKNLMATYTNMEEMIRIGAYKRGADAGVDESIIYWPKLEAFLNQPHKQRSDLESGYGELATMLSNARLNESS